MVMANTILDLIMGGVIGYAVGVVVTWHQWGGEHNRKCRELEAFRNAFEAAADQAKVAE